MWNFYRSYYVSFRDRINTGTKDIFTECGKIDDQALKIAVADGAGDVLLDLQTFEDNTLEEGFGGAVSDKSGVNSGNIVHQSMIKRFNQHSTMVSLIITFYKTKYHRSFKMITGSKYLYAIIVLFSCHQRNCED